MYQVKANLIVSTLIVNFIAFSIGVAAPLDDTFTYQGRLTDANLVADGPYDFLFSLYDANDGGFQVASPVNVNEVEVIDGYFTAELSFGSAAFAGDERWLQVALRPGWQEDPNAYTFLYPRQRITATPYSLYTKTAGDIKLPYTASTSTASNAVYITNTGTGKAIVGIGQNNDGVTGSSETPNRSGVFGYNDTAGGYGVFGSSNDGIGVFGHTHGSGTAGFFEITNPSSANNALYVTTDGNGIALKATATKTGNINNYAGYFEAAGDNGVGIYAEGKGYLSKGLYAKVIDANGTNYAVYGENDNGDGYAGYFEGRGYFSGDVGIGTSTPSAPLTIKPIIGTDIEFESGSSNADIMASNELKIGTKMPFSLSFMTDNQYRMTIKGGGDVGIGTTSPSEKLDVDGNAHVTGEYKKAYTTGTKNNATPIAYGFVNDNATIGSGTPNFSVSWDSYSQRYEITITGENFYYQDYTTIVTPSGSSPAIATTGSVSGKLLVKIYNLSGTPMQEDFQFITYKP